MDYIDEIRTIIEIYSEENLDTDYFTKDDLSELVSYCHLNLELFYDIKLDIKLIESKIKCLLETVYIYVPEEEIIPTEDTSLADLDEAYLKLEAHYNYLMNLPQPEQKSQAWFDMRNNMITASSAAQAMGESKYDTQETFIYEKVFGREFSENKFVHHGKKYEFIATMLYQHIYNVKIGEFGLLRHPEIDFIGASPDGICSSETLDGKRGSPLLGTMVEIKCPMTRKIETSGDIINGICPYYYWVQVQLQLQCCNLQRCDFIQLSIKEYDSQDDFIDDNHMIDHTEDQNVKKDVNINFGRNAVIQLLPIKFTQKVAYERREWYSKYIYPPSLDMSKTQILDWIEEERGKFKSNKLSKDYKFDKPLFFKIATSHNTTIMREDKWFVESIPKLKETWEKIKLYRTNKVLAQEFKNMVDSKKKPKVEMVVKTPSQKPENPFVDSEE